MADATCTACGGPLEAGFVTATNGSGLYWSHDASDRRLRPSGLEVLVPTGFSGMYSASLAGLRCGTCKTIVLQLK